MSRFQSQGNAQKLFSSRTLQDNVAAIDAEQEWPLLQKMLALGCLGHLDVALAKQLCGRTAEEALAAFICHLSMSIRKGHICVKIETDCITPSPSDIWIPEEIKEDMLSLDPADLDALTTLICQGAQRSPSALMLRPNKVESSHGRLVPIYQDHDRYYFQRYWQLETQCIERLLSRFALSVPAKTIPFAQVSEQVKHLTAQGKLLPEQARAILFASQSLLTLITGGPGTGKTYTAGLLLRTIWETLTPEERSHFQIALAAPTGKAAANLEASIRRALCSVEESPVIAAQTLHQLLGMRKYGRPKQMKMLMADLVLVDESSMIDMNLMSHLLQSVKPGGRLVLLGDRHQLPSVDAGSIFADLITCFESNGSEQICVAELKTCMRTELQGIVELAACIQSGNEESAMALLNASLNGVSLRRCESDISAMEHQKHLLSHVVPYFPVMNDLKEGFCQALEQFARFRILTPMRKGVLGVESLNAAIFQMMQHKRCSVFPIIVMQNDYRLGLFNGEVGLMVKEREREFALFTSREPGKDVRQIPRLLMPHFEYAYCLSIHKSQGSEFDYVVLLLPEGTQCFGREALYTGITRAKRHVEIWSSCRVLKEMIRSVGHRQSGIIERLKSNVK